MYVARSCIYAIRLQCGSLNKTYLNVGWWKYIWANGLCVHIAFISRKRSNRPCHCVERKHWSELWSTFVSIILFFWTKLCSTHACAYNYYESSTPFLFCPNSKQDTTTLLDRTTMSDHKYLNADHLIHACIRVIHSCWYWNNNDILLAQ